MVLTNDLHPIGDVAAAFGLSVSALRYYDSVGLVTPAARRGGVRYYGLAQLRQLAMVTLLRQDGQLSVAQTAGVLAGTAWRQEVRDAITGIEETIDRLRAATECLSHLLECPRADPVRECPELGKRIPGPLA